MRPLGLLISLSLFATVAAVGPNPGVAGAGALRDAAPVHLAGFLLDAAEAAPPTEAGAAPAVWPDSVTTTNTVSVEIVMPADGSMTPGGPGCDPSYPQLCVPHDAPDLECSEMGVANFVVLAPDRHRLDEDGDGIGCEA